MPHGFLLVSVSKAVGPEAIESDCTAIAGRSLGLWIKGRLQPSGTALRQPTMPACPIRVSTRVAPPAPAGICDHRKRGSLLYSTSVPLKRQSIVHHLCTTAQTNCVGPSTPPVYYSLIPRRAAGPGAHRIGQGLTVTSAPMSDRLPPVCHRSKGPGTNSVGQGLTLTATPISDRIPPVCHRSTGAERPQCWPRVNCDGCAKPRTVAYFLLTGLRGRAPTVSARQAQV